MRFVDEISDKKVLQTKIENKSATGEEEKTRSARPEGRAFARLKTHVLARGIDFDVRESKRGGAGGVGELSLRVAEILVLNKNKNH